MSEFEKELESILEKIGEYYQGITTGNVLVISKHFKDWQPPKELVVVPQCVDDAIKALPKYYAVYGAIEWIRAEIIDFEEEYEDWLDVYNWIFREDNADKFARAWLDGYTVEKEQLYVLRLPLKKYPYVSYSNSANKIITWTDNLDNAKRFTEKEIREIDDRYRAFAVKVEEVEP